MIATRLFSARGNPCNTLVLVNLIFTLILHISQTNKLWQQRQMDNGLKSFQDKA